MANECIGHVTCQWCGSKKASVSVSKAQLCVVTCRACHAQTFARGNYSDSMIRQAMRPADRPGPAPTMPEAGAGNRGGAEAGAEGRSENRAGAGDGNRAEPAPKKRGAWDIW